MPSQLIPQFDGVIIWPSFGSGGSTAPSGTGTRRRDFKRWQVFDAGFEGVFVWNSKGTGGAVVTPPTGQNNQGGASGRHYNTQNLGPDYWGRKKRRLEVKVEVVQKKIQAKRDQISEAVSLSRIEALKKQLAELQKILLALLVEIDMARKEYESAEEGEVMAVYLLYRNLH